MDNKARLGIAIYGGGNHVFYIAGVVEALLERGLKYNCVSGYSAGAALILHLTKGSFQPGISRFWKSTEINQSNFHLYNVIKRQNSKWPFPQERIYGRLVKSAIDMNKIRAYDKEARLILAEYTSHQWTAYFISSIGVIFLMVYGLTKKYSGSFFIRFFKSIFNVKGRVINISDYDDPLKIYNYVMGSSGMFPFVKLLNVDSKFQIDGKFSMISPIEALDDCDYVLSIHGHTTYLPKRENLFSLVPEKSLKINPLNYVGSSHSKKAYYLGREDAEKYYEKLKHTPFFEQ